MLIIALPAALSCPPNSHYEACSRGCPLSCGDLPVPGGCGSDCHEACVCNEGFALSGESCVPLPSCGCTYQGVYYPPGQTFRPGPGCDSLCQCQEGGLVSCNPSSCGPHEACQPSGGILDCVVVGSATCQASGDPHYTTFDGRRYDFMGTCVYVLSRTNVTRPGLQQFAVLQENAAWGNGRVSVTRVITVQVANFTLVLKQNHWKVTVRAVAEHEGEGAWDRACCVGGTWGSELAVDVGGMGSLRRVGAPSGEPRSQEALGTWDLLPCGSVSPSMCSSGSPLLPLPISSEHLSQPPPPFPCTWSLLQLPPWSPAQQHNAIRGWTSSGMRKVQGQRTIWG